jgi:glucosamine-6-phosphate deaminase
MKVRVYPTTTEATQAVASIVASQLQRKPASVLGLPTGRTSLGIYDELARLYAGGIVDFSRAHTFNVDEFTGLTSKDRRSFCAFMEKHLFQRINLPKDHIHFLDGHAADLDAECDAFEREITKAGGMDLLLLGIGTNGHIGFNEPGTSLHARSHRSKLTTETRRANAALFGGRLTAVPREALTMGIATMLDAAAIVLVATGKSKAQAVRSMFTGRITTARPASLLQLHRNVKVILDLAAAEKSSPH